MNALLRYLRTEYAGTMTDFGDEIGVTNQTVWRWAHGVSLPSWKNASMVEKVTDGKVPLGTWRF